MNLIYAIAIVLLFGITLSRFAQKLNIPSIIGYLVSGIIIGPSVLGFINVEQVSDLQTFSVITLSILSFIIGSQFKLSHVKRIGGKMILTGLYACLTTFLFISIGMILLKQDVRVALILGVIGATTAPAVVMNIFKDYKAKGKLTDTILSIVAIDDVISIILFGFTLILIENSMTNFHLISLFAPFKEIIISLILGSIMGYALGLGSKLFKENTSQIALVIVFIFSTITFANYLGISPLLICTIMGIVFVNSFEGKIINGILDVSDELLSVILIIFFVVSGATLDVTLIPQIWFIALVFIIVRVFGKWIGALLGSNIAKLDDSISKVLGLGLLSQTGLAVGLVLAASDVLKDKTAMVQSIVVLTSITIDLISPFILKMILKKENNIEYKVSLFKRK